MVSVVKSARRVGPARGAIGPISRFGSVMLNGIWHDVSLTRRQPGLGTACTRELR